jgi:hypothetical protein
MRLKVVAVIEETLLEKLEAKGFLIKKSRRGKFVYLNSNIIGVLGNSEGYGVY